MGHYSDGLSEIINLINVELSTIVQQCGYLAFVTEFTSVLPDDTENIVINTCYDNIVSACTRIIGLVHV